MNPLNIHSYLKELSSHPHCCNCGEINPEVGDYAGIAETGFTICCNEAVCKHEHLYLFGDGIDSVEACCWAVAELKFKEAKIDVSKMFEIRRVKMK